MKTIDAKSMLIGFLLCAVGFLTIGADSPSKRVTGKYQSSSVLAESKDIKEVLITVIDTQTGGVYRTYQQPAHYYMEAMNHNRFTRNYLDQKDKGGD